MKKIDNLLNAIRHERALILPEKEAEKVKKMDQPQTQKVSLKKAKGTLRVLPQTV